MELKAERMLAADRATAWAALNDTEVLKACVPGCESITPSGEQQYEILMTAAIGPVKARFKGRMTLADIDAPNSYTLKFDGQGGAAGFAKGEARVALVELAPRQTRLDYTVNVHVGGKLAQIGSRLIDAASGAMADKFFEAFGAQLAARAATEAAAQVPGAAPPPAGLGLWSLIKAMLGRLFGRR